TIAVPPSDKICRKRKNPEAAGVRYSPKRYVKRANKKPRTDPTNGTNPKKIKIFTKTGQAIPFLPYSQIKAPANPPTNAWLEELGNAIRHILIFQIKAPKSAQAS